MPELDKAQQIQDFLSRERFEREHGAASTPMPRYRCHKEVYALKIAEVIDPSRDGNESDGTRVIVPADHGYSAFRVDREYVNRHKPTAGGYYVVYDDGYKSFSPAKAFEEGYTRL